MHGLAGEPDHQVLARARLKGLHIHPAVLDAAYDPSVHRGTSRVHTPRCTSNAIESSQRGRL